MMQTELNVAQYPTRSVKTVTKNKEGKLVLMMDNNQTLEADHLGLLFYSIFCFSF
jgi:hypothetical protein